MKKGIRHIEIHFRPLCGANFIKFTRDGYTQHYYPHRYIDMISGVTPASLRRVCRLLQGNPPFFDAEQMHDPEIDAMSDEERLAAVMATAGAWQDDPPESEPVCECSDQYSRDRLQYGEQWTYCPYCGRKVKVADD